MRVLVACEFSGVVRRAFRECGHDAWSNDVLPAEDGSPFHIQCDVLSVLNENWDAMIAFPSCTRLCNSGVRWLKERNLWVEMREAAQFFNKLLKAPIPKKALENPIQHKYARTWIRKYDQIIHPHWFGHPETKATCIWLNGLPPLVPTNIVEGRTPRVHHASPGPDRWKERSRTLKGIADAMAEQWGSL